MDRNEVKYGLAALGIGIVYFGVKRICSWLVERTFVQKPYGEEMHINGHFTKEVSIFACENNQSKWNTLNALKQYDTFDLSPVSYRVSGQTYPLIELQTEKGSVNCRLERALNVKHNTCKLSKADGFINDNYNGILNYPTQLEIRFLPSTNVIVYGRLSGNTFYVSKISNYPVNKYKSMLILQKMRKSMFIVGIVAIGIAILFQQFKE